MYERKIMKISRMGALVGAGLFSMSLLAGCAGGGANAAGGTGETGQAALSGTLTASGASALKPLADIAAKSFKEKYPDVAVTINAGGSGEGLKQVSSDAVDIGNSDVFAVEKLDATQAAELVDHKVATITIAPVVNAELGVDNLTKQQLIDVFTGKVKNWSEVGGPDQEIMLITRPESSGTRTLFTKWALDGNEETKGALEDDNSGTLIESIKNNPNAIGYVALSYLVDDPAVKGVAIDGVEPSNENTYNGTYLVWGYEHMYTKGEPNEIAKAFIDFITSEEFAPEIEKAGYGVASKLTDAAKASHPDPAA